MNRLLIGLIGYAGSGKSTTADILAGSYFFERIRFAGPLKDMLRTIGLTEREIEGDLKEQPCALLGGKTPRHAMQTLGTEWRDMIDTRLWTRIWSERVRRYEGHVVTEDLRFPHEAEALRALGGIVIRIERPGCVAGSHASEAGQAAIGADYTIRNDGSVNDLRQKLADVLNEILSPSAQPSAEKQG